MVYICEAQNQKIMSRFKIRQTIVCLVDYKESGIKKGDEVIVDGFCCCPFIVINENGTCVESLSEVVDMKDYFKAELSGVTKIIIEDSDNGN